MSKAANKPRKLASAPTKTKQSNAKAKPKPNVEELQKELEGCRAELRCFRAKFDLKTLEKFQIEEETVQVMLNNALMSAQAELRKYQELSESGTNGSGDVAAKEEQRKLEKQLKSANTEIDLLQTRYKALEAQLKNKDNEIKFPPVVDKNETARLNKQIEDLRLEKENQATKIKSLESKLVPISSPSAKDFDELRAELEKSKKQNEAMATLVNEKKEVDKKLEDAEKDRTNLQLQMTDLKTKLEKAENDVQQLKNIKPPEEAPNSKFNNDQTEKIAKAAQEKVVSDQNLAEQQKEIKEMRMLLSTFKNKHAEHEALKKELKNTEQLYSKLMERYEAERQSRESARVNNDKLMDEINKLKRRHAEEIEEYVAKHARFSEELKQLKAEKDAISKERELLKSSNNTSVTNSVELDDVRQLLQTEKSAHEKTKRLKEDLEKTCHDAFEKLDKKEKEMKEAEKKHKEIIERKDKTIHELRKEKTMVDPTRPASAKTLQNQLTAAKSSLREVEEENDNLKNRLSKMAGAQLMDNNPNIADLSDENRPTKLGEKYSELYDNEWTDAYEDVEKVLGSEENTVKHLYALLTDVYTFCQSLSKKHAALVKSTALNIPEDRSVSDANDKLSPTQSRTLKEVRKSFAPYQIEAVFQMFKKTQKPKHSDGANANRYIRKSVEICWFMSVQDPPVIIDTKGKPGAKFDSDSFRTYTRTGKTIDFVVWPPVLLHEGGPMLSKGVAQGK